MGDFKVHIKIKWETANNVHEECDMTINYDFDNCLDERVIEFFENAHEKTLQSFWDLSDEKK